MIKITETEASKVTPISCPDCNEKLPYTGLLPHSKVEGLTFKCKRCRKLWTVKTE